MLSTVQLYTNAYNRQAQARWMVLMGLPAASNKAPHANRPTPARVHQSRTYKAPRGLVTGWPVKSIYKRPFKLIWA